MGYSLYLALIEDQKTYLTLASESTGEYREKGSKFLAFAYHVDDVQAVDERLDELRKKYHDARHHCYAYRLGADGNDVRANDDGEPGHSAGDPILGQIRSFGLTNTLVVVVRYFGGVKLGVSGLIQAYRIASSEALENAHIREVEVTSEYELQYPYDSTSEVLRLVDEFGARILDQEFTANCRMNLAVNVSLAEKLEEKVQLLESLGHKLRLNQNG